MHNYRFHFSLSRLRLSWHALAFLFHRTDTIFYFTGIAVLLPRSYGFLIFNFYDVLMDIFVTWPPGVPLSFVKLSPSASIKFKASQGGETGGNQEQESQLGIMQYLPVIEAI